MSGSIEQHTTDNIDLQSHPSNANNLCNSNDQWQELDIDFKRKSRSRFGFSITGGHRYSPDISIGYIEKGGAADCDGRLRLHDIILQVNKIDFTEITHDKAVRKLRSASKHIRMRIRRLVPGNTEEIPSCIQNNSTRNVTSSNVDNQGNTNNKPVNEYEVETYENLKRRLLRRIDLKIHHLIQPDIALALIPDYRESEAICIALNQSKYHPTLTTSGNPINSLLSNHNPKKFLAYDIGCNTKLRAIPTPVLLEAVQLHCQKYPRIYKKANMDVLRQDTTTINCDGNELFSLIPFIDPPFLGKLRDIMKYGNCVKDIAVKVRRFLEETGTSEVCSWENPDLSGKYVVHRDTNPLTGQSRSLIVHIKLNDSETRKEKSDGCITTTTTYYNGVTVSYQ